MDLQGFFRKPANELEKGGRNAGVASRPQVSVKKPPEAATTCPKCGKSVLDSELARARFVCPCGHHYRISARSRISRTADPDSFTELFAGLQGRDVLNFPGYEQKLKSSQLASGEKEAVLCGTGDIYGNHCCLFAMDSSFMMGSMGVAVGEKITRLFEHAAAEKMPVVGFTVSGGARMQEGILSLMQMAKTSAAVKRHSDAGLLFITVLTDPTTGGVTASFAMEGDIILAEPGALIGFAGPRVIEQTTGKKLPPDFQRAEFLLDHGFVDSIVPRRMMRRTLAKLLALHQ